MTRTAVLGAAGFIGSRAVEMLHLERPGSVVPIARRPERLAGAARFALDMRVADARDEGALTAAFAGIDAVVHAVAGDPATILGAVAPVYRAAAAAGVRRIAVLSTASVHGQDPEPGTDETSPLSDRQSIPYNNAKVRAERLWFDLRRGGSVEVVLLRPGIVHGPRSSWIAGFADECLAGTAYLVDGGRGVCNAAYVDNVVHAVRLALAVPEADGRAYIVGDAELVTWADLLCPVAAALGREIDEMSVSLEQARATLRRPSPRDAISAALHRRLPRPVVAGLKAAYREWRGRRPAASGPGREITEERILLHTARTRLGFDRARRELGYEPPVAFDEATRRTLAWLDFAGYPVVRDFAGYPVALPGRRQP
ncbi:NAD-dependent epimerase/dehydratase family protein [Prosthecomicrobium sp. N25]|uniref:NAD-dependent epimerase/dehydratase family protein n=1 Tax=Prosthecomicrobium sp. N25 TaxID=3129254 RepID=UPI003076B34F